MIHSDIRQQWRIYYKDQGLNISQFKGRIQETIELIYEYRFRVHYHIKKALAKEKNLEFLWQQPWGK